MSPPGRVGVDASSTALLSQGTPSNRLSPESLQLSTRVCAMAEMYSTQDHFLNTLIETKKHTATFSWSTVFGLPALLWVMIASSCSSWARDSRSRWYTSTQSLLSLPAVVPASEDL